GQRRNTQRRETCATDWRTQFAVYHGAAQSGSVRGRNNIPRTDFQSVAGWQSARCNRPVGAQSRAVFRRACARLPFGARDLCGRNIQLARAEADAEIATRSLMHAEDALRAGRYTGSYLQG